MKKLLFLIPLLFSLGCSGVHQIGSIGDTRFYEVRARSFAGPSITTLATQTGDGPVRLETSAAGAGIGHTLVSAAGHVGAAAVFGLSLRPDQTTVNAGGASAQSGAASTASGRGTATGGTGHVNNHDHGDE